MKTGIVGFFDILGYQNIINNNEIEKTANIISDVILNLPEKVKVKQSKAYEKIASEIKNEAVKKVIQKAVDMIKPQIISDSILITLPIKDKEYAEAGDFFWMVYLFYSCLLLEESFNSGLPLRGAIDFGQYYTNKDCIAGKTIINGYMLSNQLEFSGCTLCENADKEISSFKKTDSFGMLELYIADYLAPMKNGIEKRSCLLNWIAARTKEKPFDVRQYTLEAFHMHNKDIPLNAFQKVNNTENILRYFLMLNESRKT